MKNFLRIVLFISLISLAAFLYFKDESSRVSGIKDGFEEKSSFNSENKHNSKALTIEQKIGQLFIIGFDGKYFNSEIERLIKELHPGGILLLERNVENENQLKRLISDLQRTAMENTGPPLFIAVDQEGGLVSRIKWVDSTPQESIENEEQAYLVGKNRGESLMGLGINLNFAPLLDIASPGDFIFQRSFQKNPDIIKNLSAGLIEGQREAGILVAAKHFPGYGGISFNPEEKLAVMEKVPLVSQFESLAEYSPEMLMVSNVVYEEIDERLPFSFSERAIQFLRNNIKGDYLVISDDLAQNSLLGQFSLQDIVVNPVKAGVDILIFSGWRLPSNKGVFALRQAVESGEVAEEMIDRSFSRILRLKDKLLHDF